ncbi:DUF6176 family protein [Variovorax sp. dw_308]|uniref:DUF6176 family protein n=1 Tax=Variovorax sp. dw_308 TaxID=2721546 RepID=UPI001C486C8C|nr:DUF6176 family protein [Variovorax sp. dw_308]
MNSTHVPVCARIRLKNGVLPRVREWAAHMSAHRADALQRLVAEGVSIESVFLDVTTEGEYLVYYMRAASHEEAHRVAAQSAAELDRYHKLFQRETWGAAQRLELLLDLRRDTG